MRKTNLTQSWRFGRLAVLAMLAGVFGAGTVFAETYTWNGTADSDWQNAANWSASPGAMPIAGSLADGLVINAAGVNPLNHTSAEGTTQLNTIALTNGELIISGGIVATAGSTATVSRIAGSSGVGTLTIDGGTLTTDVWDAFYLSENNTGGFGTGQSTLNIRSGTANFAYTLQLRSGINGSATINLDGGTMGVGYFWSTGTHNTINFNGATVKALGNWTWNATDSNNRALTASTANVRDGGAVFDTNGKTAEIDASLIHSTITGDAAKDGGLVKNGTGTLRLRRANTYNGDTTVNSGTLHLYNTGELWFDIQNADTSNKITGNGAATFDGVFRLNLADLTDDSGVWHLVDVATKTYNATTFGLVINGGATFANNNDGTYSSGNWVFDTATGDLTLTAIPEPASGLVMLPMLWLAMRRRTHG